MERTKNLIGIGIILILAFSSCKNKTSADIDLREHLTAYTQGMINAEDLIEFRFVNGIDIDAEELKKEIATTPSFEYTLKLSEDKRKIQLTPQAPLQRGKSYEVKLNLNNLYVKKIQGSVVSKLKIFEQHVEVEREGLILDGNKTVSYTHLTLPTKA